MSDLISKGAVLGYIAMTIEALTLRGAQGESGKVTVIPLHEVKAFLDAMSSEFDALSTALPAAPAVKVKPLEWRRDGCQATGLGIFYAMGEGEPGMFELTSPFHSKPMSREECQKTAQADYETRILSALEVRK